MAEIKLTVDASQAQAALKAVNNAITKAKLNGATIQLDGKNVTNGLNNIQDAAKKTGQVIEKTTTEQAKNATKGMKGVTDQFGKGLGQIRGFLSGAVSWWTALIIAVELATKTLKYFFDNLTQSTTKMTTRGQNAVKVAELSKKKVQQETKAAQDLITKLIELNKVQSLNADQQRLADSIVAKLNRQYKDLGITLDQTTGKYKGLYQAQREIDQRNNKVQANALNNQIRGQRDIINAALKTAFGTEINIGKNVSGNDFFTIAQKIGGTLGAQNSELLAQKWNTKDISKQLEVIDQLIGGISSSKQFMQNASAVRDAMQQLVDYKKQLQDLNSIDTQIVEAEDRLTNALKEQRDVLKSTREETEKLNKSYEDQQRANSLAGLDPEDRANALRGEVEQLKKKNEQLQKTQEIEEEQSRWTNLNANSDRRAFDRINNERRALEQQISELRSQKEQNEKRSANLDVNLNRITGNSYIGKDYYRNNFYNRDKLRGELEAALKSASGLHVNPVDPKDIEDLQRMLRYLNESQELMAEEVSLRYKLNKAQKQLGELNKQAKQTQIDLSNSQSTRLQQQQKIADLEKERAENTSAIQAKEQQIAEIEAQIAKERADAELKAWQLEQQRIKSYSDFVNDLMKKQVEGLNEILGKKKDNLLLELQINAEKVRGRKLTEEEVAALKSYVDVMSLQDQFKANQKLNIQSNGVISNDIARKGGWASSVVVDRAQDINKQILDVQKSQVDLMSKLNETMKTSNDLLKQFSVIQ